MKARISMDVARNAKLHQEQIEDPPFLHKLTALRMITSVAVRLLVDSSLMHLLLLKSSVTRSWRLLKTSLWIKLIWLSFKIITRRFLLWAKRLFPSTLMKLLDISRYSKLSPKGFKSPSLISSILVLVNWSAMMFGNIPVMLSGRKCTSWSSTWNPLTSLSDRSRFSKSSRFSRFSRSSCVFSNFVMVRSEMLRILRFWVEHRYNSPIFAKVDLSKMQWTTIAVASCKKIDPTMKIKVSLIWIN